jgi:hypothetical protein
MMVTRWRADAAEGRRPLAAAALRAVVRRGPGREAGAGPPGHGLISIIYLMR